MVEPIDGRELLAIRARTARAGYGLHQSFAVTEADREVLLREVYRLRAELELHVGCRLDVSIGDALRLIRGEESNADARTPVTALAEAHGEAGGAEDA
jgi:hypothetical protein